MELTQEYFDQQFKNVATKEDIKNLRSEMAIKTDLQILRHQLDTALDWIKQVAPKIGVEYKA
jgi:hypothetical protein